MRGVIIIPTIMRLSSEGGLVEMSFCGSYFFGWGSDRYGRIFA